MRCTTRNDPPGDWNALCAQLRRDHRSVREDAERLLLSCALPCGQWLVRIQRTARAGGATVDIAVLVGNTARVPPGALRAATAGVPVENLKASGTYLVLSGAVPLAGLDDSRLREQILVVAEQARWMAERMRAARTSVETHEHYAD